MDPGATGAGDSPAQAAAFGAGSDLLFGFADAAHWATIQRIAKVTLEQMGQEVQYVLGDTRPT